MKSSIALMVVLLSSVGGADRAAAQSPAPTETSSRAEGTFDAWSLLRPDDARSELTRSSTAAASPLDLGSVRIQGRRRKRAAPVSRFEVDIAELGAVPKKNAAQQLMFAPGVLVTNVGGEGHANDTFLRGFAAGTGQDIEFLVDGVPINEVSNAHNHGYADLFFVPPEMVERVSVTNGVFDPEQGDFAFAGTAAYQLGVPERGSRVGFSYGRFDTQRMLGVIAPHGTNAGTFAGFELTRSAGFGENRAYQRGLALARYEQDDGTDALRWSVSAFGYGGRWDTAGVVRQDDVEDGTVDFFGTYDPNQGGESKRLLLSLRGAVGPTDATFEQSAYFGVRGMRNRENFTGFVGDSQTPQRGDGVEQRYSSLTVGGRGSYRLATRRFGQTQEIDLGYALRLDRGRSEQLNLRAVTSIPYQQVFAHDFEIFNASAWLRTQLRPLSWLAIRGGLRVETFSFGVRDTNQPSVDREGERVPNQTAQSFGFALNPRVSVEARPLDDLSVTASYGQGTRSTDAAALSDNETAPFARAQEFEVGAKYGLGGPQDNLRLQLQAAYVFAAIDKDLVFDQTQARNTLLGASTRHAFLLGARASWAGWLEGLLNLGFTQATIDSTGDLIPYIPQVVVRADLGARHALFDWTVAGQPVIGRAGLGFTYVPGRPLLYQETGDAFALLSASAGLRLWHVDLGIEARNLLNRRYRQSEFNYASNFGGPNTIASRIPERHFAAGEPLYVAATITVFVEDLFRESPGS